MAKTNGKITVEMAQMQALETAKQGAKNSKKVYQTEVVRTDDAKIVIPNNVPLQSVIDSLNRQLVEDEQVREMHAAIPAFPYDGAYAMSLALKDLFGYALSENVKGMFGNSNSDKELVIDAHGTTVTVPWGRFSVPGIEGILNTSYTWEEDRVIFEIQAEIRGKHKHKFDALVERTKEIVREQSIYKGKVLNIRFSDQRGRPLPMPEIRFVDVEDATQPIFTEYLTDKLEYDILSYVRSPELVRGLSGGYLKRGALLAGPYGTGKTLTAAYIAKVASENGFTFIYCDKPHDFYQAHLLARAYQPAVIFVEDVEYLAGVERTEEVNRMLNVLDGPDTKNMDIICIFTSNHGEKINPAMFRPGRIDLTMVVLPPDAKAALRLVRQYANNQVTEEDFTEAGEKLAGMIPATIKEAVARARIRAVIRTGNQTARISNQDLVAAAQSIENERTTFNSVAPSDIQKLGHSLGLQALAEASDLFNKTRPSSVDDTYDRTTFSGRA